MSDERPRVLFVCTGNACRSPLAEVIARDMWGDRAEVHSAGSLADDGGTASRNAMLVADELGLDLTKFRSTSLSFAEEPDFVFAMEPSHVAAVRQRFPDLPVDTIRLLDPMGVGDPIGQPLDTYRRVAAQITSSLQAIELR